ncbi:MAG: cytochrome c oxidase assembly protein [Rhodobacteraceae bacterium]|nr:cytochrome c oxidase assembly protein [Paracoccaceae bacterium]
MSVASKNNKMLFRLVSVAALMLALSFAAVPMYNWFCRVTGFGGQPLVSADGSNVILDQTIKIRFDGSLERDMPWQFGPVVKEMELKIGETGLAFYEAHNPTDKPIAGSASYNVFPYAAGGYFTKIDCFCFEMQVLQPGERVQMPVTFYVDPEMVNDRDARHIKSITLSYTFHVAELPEDHVALVSGRPKQVN